MGGYELAGLNEQQIKKLIAFTEIIINCDPEDYSEEERAAIMRSWSRTGYYILNGRFPDEDDAPDEFEQAEDVPRLIPTTRPVAIYPPEGATLLASVPLTANDDGTFSVSVTIPLTQTGDEENAPPPTDNG